MRARDRRRDFRLLLAGQTTSQLGTQVSGVAVPLLAVVTLHAGPFEVGLVSAAGTVAFALIGLPTGAWLDRMRKRPALVAGDAVRAALLATIPVAGLLGVLTIGQLVVVMLLVGAARVVFDVGYQSYLPTVTGPDRILAGNAAMETLRASGQVVGPGVGGVLVSLVGAAAVVLVQAVTFAVSAVSLLAIRAREEPAPRLERPHLGREIREGLAVVVRSPVLRATAAASAFSNVAFAVASAVTVLFLARELLLPPAAIGLVVALGAVAAMAGAAITPRAARRIGSARIVWVALAVAAPFGLLVPLAQPGWPVALAVAGAAGGELGQLVYAITNVSLRQRVVPARLLGRVNATMRFLVLGAFPLGALGGGLLGAAIGVRGTLWVAAALVLVSPIPPALALRGVRDVDDLPATPVPEEGLRPRRRPRGAAPRPGRGPARTRRAPRP